MVLEEVVEPIVDQSVKEAAVAVDMVLLVQPTVAQSPLLMVVPFVPRELTSILLSMVVLVSDVEVHRSVEPSVVEDPIVDETLSEVVEQVEGYARC